MRTAHVLLALLAASLAAPGQRPRPERPPALPPVDVEVAYVRFHDVGAEDPLRPLPEKLQAAMARVDASEEEIAARIRHHGGAYVWVPGGAEGIREHVRREIRAARILARLADEVTPKSDLEALARERGLSFHRFRKAEPVALQVHPEVGGPRAMMMIHGIGVPWARQGKLPLGSIVPYVSKTTTYWPGIFDEPGAFLAIYRLTAIHEPETR